MDRIEGQFDRDTKDLLHSARDEYMAAFTKAAHADDTEGLLNEHLSTKRLRAHHQKCTHGSLTQGKNSAARELKVDAPAIPRYAASR